MPREKINGTERDGYDVQVGWHPDATDVQLGVETTDGRSLLTTLYGSGPNLERIGRTVAAIGRKPLTDDDALAFGREVLDVIEGGIEVSASGEVLHAEHGGHLAFSSVWSRLDRHGCNRLIRMLRRARDTAFGSDE